MTRLYYDITKLVAETAVNRVGKIQRLKASDYVASADDECLSNITRTMVEQCAQEENERVGKITLSKPVDTMRWFSLGTLAACVSNTVRPQ